MATRKKIDTRELIGRQGGEVKGTSKGFDTRNVQDNYREPAIGNETDQLRVETSSGISGVKFDVAKAFFARKGVPESIARTYGAALIDTSRRTGVDITDLVKTTENNKNEFTDDSLTQINLFRPKTSQIGYRIPRETRDSDLIARSIIA